MKLVFFREYAAYNCEKETLNGEVSEINCIMFIAGT
jgi:hypothetical protein